MTAHNYGFRFLDLPREIRDNIYDLTLCAFRRRSAPYSIDQYARIHSESPSYVRHFLGNINLLLASKQVHGEGSDYMLKRCRFVRIECRGFNLGQYLHGHAPAVSVLASRTKPDPKNKGKVDKFQPCAMRIWLGIDRAANGKQRLGRKRYRDIVMLWEDLPNFWKKFEVECAMRSQSDPERDPLRIVVELNPDSRTSGTGQHSVEASIIYTNKDMQEQLLQPVRTGLRGFPRLEILECVDESLARAAIADVAKPLVSEWKQLQTEIEKCKSCATTAWLCGDITRSAHFCATGIDILRPLRQNPLSPNQTEHKADEYQSTISKFWIELHMLFVRCLDSGLTAPPLQGAHIDESLHVSSTSQLLIRMLTIIHGSVNESSWKAPNNLLAEMWYMMAKSTRLMFEHAQGNTRGAGENILKELAMALNLSPGYALYVEEKKLVEEWVEELERYQVWKDGECRRTRSRKGTLTLAEWRKTVERRG